MEIKKGFLKVSFVVFLIVFLFVFINNVGAKGLTGKDISEEIVGVDVEGMADKITEMGDILSDEEARSEFLKKEWVEFLSGTKAGKFLQNIDNFLVKLNPVFRTLLGLEWKFSWVFFLALVLWFLFIDYAYAFFDFFEPYFKRGKVIKWIGFLASFVVISSVRIPKYSAKLIVGFISGDMHWTWRLILAVAGIGVLILLFGYADKIVKYAGKLKWFKKISEAKEGFEKQKKELEKEKKERKKLEEDVRKGKYETPKKKTMEEEAEEEAKAELEGTSDEIIKGEW